MNDKASASACAIRSTEESGPESRHSSTNNAASIWQGSSSVSTPQRNAAFWPSPQAQAGTRRARGTRFAGVSSRSAGVRKKSISSFESSRSFANSTIRSRSAANASHSGVHVTITSQPRSSSVSSNAQKASTRAPSSNGTSSNTARNAGSVASSKPEAMLSPSRSRKKQGLVQSNQYTWLNPNTVSAYSRTTDDLPNPGGATKKRATLRSRRRRETKAGRE